MANRLPTHFIETLLSKINIVDIIGSKINLKSRGANYLASCPFHKEKTPSFTVSVAKQIYHCFGCGKSGDSINFLMNYHSLSFMEAVTELAARAGLSLPLDTSSTMYPAENESTPIYEVLMAAAKIFTQQLLSPQAKTVLTYIQERGITSQTIQAYDLGFAPAGNRLTTTLQKQGFSLELLLKSSLTKQYKNQYYDFFSHRLIFPIRDERARIIGFGGRTLDNRQPKYLNSSENLVFHKSSCLYGIFEAKKKSLASLFIVEGYFDVLSLSQAGFSAVAALGTACTMQHIKKLFALQKELIFCFDGDAAGNKAAQKALHSCLPMLQAKHKVKFLLLPDNHDPASLLAQHNKEHLQTLLETSLSWSDYFFHILLHKADLTTIENKAYLLQQGRTLLQQLTDPDLQALMLERLNDSLNVATLRTTKKSDTPFSSFRMRKHLRFVQPKHPAMIALSLLLLHREFINDSEELCLLTPKDELTSLLLSCLAIIKNNPHITFLEIHHKLPEKQQKHLHPQLESFAKTIPAALHQEEYRAALKNISQSCSTHLINDLLHKAKTSTLSATEQEQLKHLLTQAKDHV